MGLTLELPTPHSHEVNIFRLYFFAIRKVANSYKRMSHDVKWEKGWEKEGNIFRFETADYHDL